MSRPRFHSAIARMPGANAGDGLTTAALGPPDIGLMLAQYDACLQVYRQLGIDLTVLPADAAFPDGCFVEDTAVIIGNQAIITRPGAPSRRDEVTAIEPLLTGRCRISRIEAPGCVDGGDVIIAGDVVLVGQSGRTNAEGARQLEQALSASGLQVRTVPVAAGLHLKSDVNYLGDDTLLLTAAFAGCAELAGFRQIQVVPGEEYAANCVVCGDDVLLPAGFSNTLAQLVQLGFRPHELDMSEFRKMDGGLSCLSLRFD